MNELMKNYFKKLSEKQAHEGLFYLINKYDYEVQYANEKNYRNLLKYSYEVLEAIKEKYENKKILDFGCGISSFDYFNKLFFDYDLDSCDWKNRDEIYDKLCFKTPHYYCSDWTKENFQIYKCSKKYDAIIIMRSIFLHNNTLDNFISLMNKLLPYIESSGIFIILQPFIDFKGEIRKFLDLNDKPFFNIKNNNGDIFVLEPSSIKTFIN